MRILPGLVLMVAMATGCGGAKKKSPNNPTNQSHETEKKSDDKDGDKDGDVKNKDANEGDDDSSSPRSADPCEGGQ